MSQQRLHPGGRPQRYSDLAITIVLVIKHVFRLTLRVAQAFIDSIFSLMNVPLRCPDYTSVSKRVKSVNVSFKAHTQGEIAHLVIDSTGLKVFGEGNGKSTNTAKSSVVSGENCILLLMAKHMKSFVQTHHGLRRLLGSYQADSQKNQCAYLAQKRRGLLAQ